MTRTEMTSGGNHWNQHAIQWNQIGPPLRPSPEDLTVIENVMSELDGSADRLRLDGLILGVTQEFASLPWPAKSRLVAWECNEWMIRHVWPGSRAESEIVIHGNWLEPRTKLGPFNLVLGDGALSMLKYPDEYQQLAEILRGFTRTGGRWILRIYARPTTPQDPQSVISDVLDGRLGNVNEFKLRLGMALCELTGTDDVAVTEMWKYWKEWCRRYPLLENQWSVGQRATIENYRDSSMKYSFPKLEPVLAILRKFATVRDVRFPSYQFGGSCPTIILEL